MGEFSKALFSKLHPVNPYEGFDPSPWELDLQGGGGTPVLQQVVDALKPRLVIDVGTWKGASALFFAQLMKDRGIDGAVICVDTWLGGIEHITRPEGSQWDILKYRKNGYSTLYFQFLANVVHRGLQDYVIPFPTSSLIGARWLLKNNLQPDLVYVDASHEEDDVYDDLTHYWKTIRHGGMLCGDDWNAYWYGVICAVNRFTREKQLNLQVGAPTWVLQKSLSADQQLVVSVMHDELNKLKKFMQARVAA